MSPYKFEHAIEFEIESRHLARVHRGPKTLVCVSTVDPARLQPAIVCRLVIVEHAFCRVQDLLSPHPDFRQLLDHVFEISR